VSWYLPGRPRLELASGQPCVRAFAVAPEDRGRRVLERAEDTRTVDDVVVARVPCDGLQERVGGEHGFLFVAAAP
jgi:hypothetical protein